MVDVLVKKSNISGRGVFANKNFRKGEVVIKWKVNKFLAKKDLKNLTTDDLKYVNHVGWNQYIVSGVPERYVNHSCSPNTFIKDNCDIAIKDIRKGEEITSDYVKGKIPDSFICKCGSRSCKGKVNIR